MLTPVVPPTAAELRRAPTVARQVELSLPTIYRLISAGQFPRPVHIGRASRWVGAEVDRWIADRIVARDASTPVQAEDSTGGAA